jgi:hypothetical protein
MLHALADEDITALAKRRPDVITRFAETGVKIERLARGESTERTEGKTTLIDEAVAALPAPDEGRRPGIGTLTFRRSLPSHCLSQVPCDRREDLPAISVERQYHLDELDHIEPALPSLVLGNEGLGTTQAFCHLNLRETGVVPSADQHFAKALVHRAGKRSAHAATSDRLVAEA